ncbi:MAG: hypothetical protein Q9162_003314 [Coniocarpon cinnabarinum]
MGLESTVSSVISYQPFKGAWTLLAVLFNAARIPLWILYYTPRPLRQNPNWTLGQCVRVRVIRAFLWNAAMIQMRVPMALAPGVEQARFITLPPAKEQYFTGVTAADPDVQPIEIGGTWYPEKPDPSVKKPGLVALHFHGGAYAIGDGREQDAGFGAQTILKNTDATHVFCPQYRLATHPNCRFPAQLQDAISAYVYLQDMGIPAEQIVVGGDSAGGHLTLCLLRYLSESGDKVGLQSPACAWLWSPWSAPRGALDYARFNRNPFANVDYVGTTFGRWGCLNLAPSEEKTGLTVHSPMLNYVDNPFPSKTPMWVQYGGNEILLHDGVKMTEQLRLVEGNVVDIEITKDAPHDIILIGHLLGFADQARTAAVLANEFLRKQVGVSSG